MEPEVVTVFECDDPVLIAMAETLLKDADVPFNLEGGERRSRIHVRPDHADRAREVLDELPDGPEIDDDAADSAWNQ